jgi:dGTPase
VVRDLFGAYMNDANLLPPEWRDIHPKADTAHFARAICDFLAGMTDNFALEQHRRLFDLDPLFR